MSEGPKERIGVGGNECYHVSWRQGHCMTVVPVSSTYIAPITMITKLIGCYYNFNIKRLVFKDEGRVEVFFISSSFTISKHLMIYFLCRLVVEVVKKHPKFIPHTIDFVNSVEKWTPDRWVCILSSPVLQMLVHIIVTTSIFRLN